MHRVSVTSVCVGVGLALLPSICARVSGEWLGSMRSNHHVCSQRFPRRISALVWGSRYRHWDGWGGRSVLGEVLRPEICWGAYMEKKMVRMVSHGMALGLGLLNRLVLPPLKRKIPTADD